MKLRIRTADDIRADADAAHRPERIAELKRLLCESDFKALPDYDQPNDDIIAQRRRWRDEIRALQAGK